MHLDDKHLNDKHLNQKHLNDKQLNDKRADEKQADQNETIWRRNASAAETLLLREISKRQFNGYKFRRQVCSEPFAVEFVCNELKLVIELYSGKYQACGEAINYRTRSLQSKGYQIARFCHNEILTNLMGVIDSLAVVCRQRKKEIAMSQLARRYLSGGLGKSVATQKALNRSALFR